MEDCARVIYTDKSDILLPTDPEFIKGIGALFACCDNKKCCKKYKRGKRCKKCPNA